MLYLIFSDNNLIVKESNEGYSLPDHNDVASIKNHLSLIKEDNTIFIACVNKDKLDSIWNTIDFREALNHFDKDLCQKIIYYLQLIHYYNHHRYCGICSHSLIRQQNSIYLICEKCQHVFYPKLAPCVIVRISHGDKILLARSPHFPPNIWGLIAGFVDLGESLEEAIHREVMEEVGITIENIRYWGSQSWPTPTSSLMIGFTADYKSGEIQIDNNEIEAAGFFNKDDISIKLPSSASIARKMIDHFFNSR